MFWDIRAGHPCVTCRGSLWSALSRLHGLSGEVLQEPGQSSASPRNEPTSVMCVFRIQKKPRKSSTGGPRTRETRRHRGGRVSELRACAPGVRKPRRALERREAHVPRRGGVREGGALRARGQGGKTGSFHGNVSEFSCAVLFRHGF